MKKEYVKRYSQAFKQEVVKEYEAGASAKYLSEKYGIGGGSTIKGWVKKYGREGYRSEIAIIQTVEDQEEVKGMRKRIKELEAALAQSVLDNRMLETIVEVSSRELGIDLKKKTRSKVISEVSKQKGVSKIAGSEWYKISRQAHYQAVKREMAKAAQEQLIVELVQNKRQKHPRMGGRKVLHEIRPMMNKLGIYRGRDAFFDLLRQRDLLVPKKRNKRRTTRAGLWRCPNLIAELELSGINQVWVADITYLTTEQGFVYLALLTDAFSRFIVGYDVSSSLAVEGCLRALNRATKHNQLDSLNNLIHHSDHGVQYTAWSYCDLLRHFSIRSSMGEVGNCYDNPLAERMNGILKDEYALDSLFVNLEQAQAATHEAIYLYNYERPHASLKLSKPAHVHFS